jgi:hypothetical protein
MPVRGKRRRGVRFVRGRDFDVTIVKGGEWGLLFLVLFVYAPSDYFYEGGDKNNKSV